MLEQLRGAASPSELDAAEAALDSLRDEDEYLKDLEAAEEEYNGSTKAEKEMAIADAAYAAAWSEAACTRVLNVRGMGPEQEAEIDEVTERALDESRKLMEKLNAACNVPGRVKGKYMLTDVLPGTEVREPARESIFKPAPYKAPEWVPGRVSFDPRDAEPEYPYTHLGGGASASVAPPVLENASEQPVGTKPFGSYDTTMATFDAELAVYDCEHNESL